MNFRQSAFLFGVLLAVAAPANAQTKLIIATVNNPDMERMQRLSETFTSANPDIELEWVFLDENTLRQRVTTDIATSGGRFDIVTIGTYEAPIWAERGWLAPLSAMPDGYDVEDLLPTIRESLSFDGNLYAAPFYGESSFTMYRTDLFEQAGLEMPDAPTWDFIRTAASAISEQNDDVYGICLRGKAGWGENVALITAMANSYGARWFDMNWRPELDSEAWASTVNDYVSLMRDYGPPDGSTLRFLSFSRTGSARSGSTRRSRLRRSPTPITRVSLIASDSPSHPIAVSASAATGFGPGHWR
jgi:sorbitol/mannitol transport system substrate-binding protein